MQGKIMYGISFIPLCVAMAPAIASFYVSALTGTVIMSPVIAGILLGAAFIGVICSVNRFKRQDSVDQGGKNFKFATTILNSTTHTLALLSMAFMGVFGTISAGYCLSILVAGAALVCSICFAVKLVDEHSKSANQRILEGSIEGAVILGSLTGLYFLFRTMPVTGMPILEVLGTTFGIASAPTAALGFCVVALLIPALIKLINTELTDALNPVAFW